MTGTSAGRHGSAIGEHGAMTMMEFRTGGPARTLRPGSAFRAALRGVLGRWRRST